MKQRKRWMAVLTVWTIALLFAAGFTSQASVSGSKMIQEKNSKYTTGAGAIAAAMESIPAEAVELTKAEAQKAQEAREQAEAEAKRKGRKKLREKRQKKLHGHRSLQKIRNFWHRSSSVRQEISLMKDRLRSEQ